MSRLGYGRRSSIGENLGVLAIGLMLYIPLAIFNGAVIKTLWNWFMPLIFEGIPRLGIGTAIGLALVVGYLLPSPGDSDDDHGPWESLFTSLFAVLIKGLIFLLIGVFVHASIT